MAYRGEDLDLRTPQSWGSAGRETPLGAEREPNWWTRTTIYKGGHGDPIWVDDIVMECANHAYDLALAHRSPEVRLEHMINALTLNDHAIKVLELRGIGVSSLRRESGAVIASGLPTASTNGHSAPKRSEALEETLRLAADHAYPRRTPVTVEDLLHVMFDAKRELPGQQLLHRHASRWQQRPVAEPRSELRLDPLPHLASGYEHEPRYLPPPSAEPVRPRYASHAASDYFKPQMPPTREQHSAREREQPAGFVDPVQNSRIEALERAVRDFGLDLVNERKSLQTLVADLQMNAAAQADDTLRFRGGLTDRLNSLEDALNRTQGDVGGAPDVARDLSERLLAVERSLDHRLAELGRAWSGIAERLQALETAARRQSEPIPAQLMQRLDRLDELPSANAKIVELERTYQLILDRMTGIERKLGDGAFTQDLDTSIENRIDAMEKNVVSSLASSVDLTPVSELMSGIETRVAGLERSLENRTAETGRTVSFIGERLRAFEEAMAQLRTHSTERLAELETALSGYAETAMETSAGHQRDLAELHEALIKLNGNQQTLANSLDQWRLDNTGDISVVGNRLKVMEEAEQRRTPALESLSAQVAEIYAAVARREVRRSRFRHWLFGTEEWYSASYDTENWRARRDAEALRGLEGHSNVAPLQRPTPPPTVRRA